MPTPFIPLKNLNYNKLQLKLTPTLLLIIDAQEIYTQISRLD